jgi:putative transposase
MKYRFMLGREDYPAAKWAKYLKVSRSGYYTWLKHREERAAKKVSLDKVVCEVFNGSNGTYGPGRIAGRMRRMGLRASRATVQKSMGRSGLKSVHCKRRARSLTNSVKSRGDGFANLTKGTKATAPFQVLTSDISYIRTGEGFEYLCQIKDVASGIALGWSMSPRMGAEIVVDTLHKALSRWDIPAGSIFHSDRGSQYTSERVKRSLTERGLRQSFSRVGKPGDNAWSESFFANLKKESVHWVHFATREEARQAMFGYIEAFYNTKRIQKRLGYLSPLEWLEFWERGNENLTA